MTWHHRTTYAVITTYPWGPRIRVFCSPCQRLVMHHHCRRRLWPARSRVAKVHCACCGKPTHADELMDGVCCYCIENMRIPARKEVPIGASVATIDPSTS